MAALHTAVKSSHPVCEISAVHSSQRTAEILDECHGAGLGGGAGIPGLLDKMGRYGTVDDAQYMTHDLEPAGKYERSSGYMGSDTIVMVSTGLIPLRTTLVYAISIY